jgi:hypothetical protein
LSATKAAKSAVEMCRDLEEDEALGDEDEYSLDENHEEPKTYGDWYADLSDVLSEEGISLERLKKDDVISVENIQSLYSEGYSSENVAEVLKGELASKNVVLDESKILARELGVDIDELMRESTSHDVGDVELNYSGLDDEIDMDLTGMPTHVTEEKEDPNGVPMENGFMEMISGQVESQGVDFPGAISSLKKIGDK